MNLFENLQAMKESKRLIERDSLSVSEYNKIKIALNKNNPMKANFILHPGKVEQDNYKLRIKIYGAFRSFERTRDSYHAWKGELKNDQATKEGVGIELYNVYINLVDDSIKFSDVDYDYYIKRYINNYKGQLIKDGSVNSAEMDVDNLTNVIIDVAEKSKVDLETLLKSKNFIYNLTGKKKTEPKDSSQYNLDLENTTLNEDFDPSMPNWLMRAIKMNNDSRFNSHKDPNYNMALDKMKWTVEPFPEKGKLANISDNERIALLIDRSGDSHKGDYIVYFPSAYIGNNETIEINGRNRRIDSMSLRALAPYVKEYAHSIDSANFTKEIVTKQRDRGLSRDGSIDRVTPDDRYMYTYATTIDKSGYVVDPNKYTRLLAQLKSNEYSDRLEDLYTVLCDLRTKLKSYFSQDNIIPDPKADRYSSNRVSIYNIKRAYEYYESATSAYRDAIKNLENISSGSKGRWGEAKDEFEKNVKASETNVVNCLNVIESK